MHGSEDSAVELRSFSPDSPDPRNWKEDGAQDDPEPPYPESHPAYDYSWPGSDTEALLPAHDANAMPAAPQRSTPASRTDRFGAAIVNLCNMNTTYGPLKILFVSLVSWALIWVLLVRNFGFADDVWTLLLLGISSFWIMCSLGVYVFGVTEWAVGTGDRVTLRILLAVSSMAVCVVTLVVPVKLLVERDAVKRIVWFFFIPILLFSAGVAFANIQHP